MKTILAVLAAAMLSGCAWNMTLMPRDSGKVYTGQMTGNGMGSGQVTVNIDGVTCSGPAQRVASNDTFGFMNTYGRSSRGGSMTATSTYFAEGDKVVKALMSCGNGRGLRCELVGRSSGGGGICVDDTGRVYDVIASQ